MREYRGFQVMLIDELHDDSEQAYVYFQVALEEFGQDSQTEHLMLTLRKHGGGTRRGA